MPLGRLAAAVIRLAVRLLRKMPRLLLRVLNIALNPKGHLRQLALVIVVQIVSSALRVLRQRVLLDKTARKQQNALSYEEWLLYQEEIDEKSRQDESNVITDAEFFAQLNQRRETYEHLQETGDEYGLMFRLRSELMRRHAGGAGYNRDGSTWLRKHAVARDRIEQFQQSVCKALRYIGSGEAPDSARPAQRLAFINETRHAFGRTALLLSGGAAFGVKHLGVIAALRREQLLPRIVCGTSAGSIVAAAVCVRNERELLELVEDRGVMNLLCSLKFFGLRRGDSATNLVRSSASYVQSAVEWDVSRGRKHMKSTQNLLDSSVLQQTIVELIGGDITFLDAFDRTGRVLNITVTRSDGRAPPLLCNYMTTPHLLVYSASLASCAIPGVFAPVELMAKGRDGQHEPYFKTGGWRWTDGGLQADLPKERLTELFNVNQFIVSQVNPLAPLFIPVGGTGLPWLEEVNVFLKHQLVGWVQGASKLWSGKLVRPGGFRGVDFVLQDYEGTVTIRPHWSLTELRNFLANFDERRIGQYMDDGERATWPQLPLIRSLCEVEFCLDEVAASLQRQMASARLSAARAHDHGKLPSYVDLQAYGGKVEASSTSSSIANFQAGPDAGSRADSFVRRPNGAPVADDHRLTKHKLPGVASFASLVSLAALDDDAVELENGESLGMGPFAS